MTEWMKETLNILWACYNSINKTLTCIHTFLRPQQQKLCGKQTCLINKISICVWSIYNSLRAVHFVNHSWSFVCVLLHSVCHMFVRVYGFFQGADTQMWIYCKGLLWANCHSWQLLCGRLNQLRSRGERVVFLWKINPICVPGRVFQIYRRKKASCKQASDNFYTRSDSQRRHHRSWLQYCK